MTLLPRRALYAVAAVADVALHARLAPVSAKALAARLDLPPRYLEPVLRALVRGGLLKAVRGPRGGYELARERRRMSVGDIVRVLDAATPGANEPRAALVDDVVIPALARAGEAYLTALDAITLDDLCGLAGRPPAEGHFTI